MCNGARYLYAIGRAPALQVQPRIQLDRRRIAEAFQATVESHLSCTNLNVNEIAKLATGYNVLYGLVPLEGDGRGHHLSNQVWLLSGRL